MKAHRRMTVSLSVPTLPSDAPKPLEVMQFLCQDCGKQYEDCRCKVYQSYFAGDARTQLLNPSRRISEIAYEVGFQSLTQFNRTFKRVFGQSPTEFRARLSSGKRSRKAA